MRLVLCAYGRAGVESIHFLLSKYNLSSSDILVFTHERSDNQILITHLNNLEIKFETRSINNFLSKLEQFEGDLLISMHYRNIISGDVLKLFNGKAINVHPSLLPKYRGALSSVWAIINNEKFTGVSYHFMNEKIDDVKIIIQKKICISKEDTAFSLYHKLISISIYYLKDAIDLVMNGYEGSSQIGVKSYYGRTLPCGGQIELNDSNFEKVERFVRAMNFPSYTPALVLYNGDLHHVSTTKQLVNLINSNVEK